jgi:hypothetical protein
VQRVDVEEDVSITEAQAARHAAAAHLRGQLLQRGAVLDAGRGAMAQGAVDRKTLAPVGIDDLRGVEQAAADLPGCERGQTRPLEAAIGEPEPRIGAIDAAIALAVIGNPPIGIPW